ncbi:hypothetical protein BKA69DRAFT_1172648 [Paraphysoderma sedebokerense]|nr:hypothetical protein BKA69DRAFT_1172648 [Paraphysoderma sedebokerense]
MLKGKNPNHAISLIDNLGIYRATFLIPPEIRLYNDNMCELGGSEINIHDKASQATATIKWLLSNLPSRFTHLSALLSAPLFSHSSPSLRLLYLCAALSPYRHYKYQAKPNRPDTITVSSHLIVKNSLKLSTHDADMSTKILSDLSALQTTLSALFSSSMSKDHPENRLQLGNLIRSLALPKNIIGSLYPITIVLNLTLLLAPLFKYTVSDKLECIVQEEDSPSWDDDNHEVIAILKLHDELWGDIKNLKLEQIWNLNSLLSLRFRRSDVHISDDLQGSKVQSLLALSPGPEIKTVLDKVIEYQIMYPEQHEAEILENWVVEEFKDKVNIAAKRGSDEESEPGKVKGKKRRKR